MTKKNKAKVVYEKQTAYNLVQVIDKNGYRYLVFIDPDKPAHLQKPESIYQGYMALNNPYRTPVPFADYFHLAWIFSCKLKKVLMIGLGAATVPKRFLTDYPEIQFTTVEIDPEVVEIAYQYFYLPIDLRHKVIIADGRNFIQNCSSTFDLVLLDAFFCQSIPHHLFTVEFFAETKQRLVKNGMLGINFGGALRGPNSYLFRALYKTLSAVFPRIYVFTKKKSSPASWQHIKLFALTEDLHLTPDEIFQRAKKLAQNKVSIKDFYKKAQTLYTQPININGVKILSDKYPPPDNLLNL